MRQLHDAPPVMRHGVHPSGGFGLGSATVDPSFQMTPVKCEPLDATPYMYGQGGVSPMYAGIPSPSRLVDYPAKPQGSPSPSSLAPVSPMAQPHIMVPSPSPALSINMAQRTNSPMGAVSSASPNPYPVSLVVVGDQNIYNMQTPMRRDASLPNIGGAQPFGQPTNMGQTGSIGQLTNIAQPPNMTQPTQNQTSLGNAMDVEQQNFSLELSLGNLDSADLAVMGLPLSEANFFDANLSENLSSHLTLADTETGHRSSQACGIQQQQLLRHQQGLQNLETHHVQQKEKRMAVQLEKTEDEGTMGVLPNQNMTDSFTRQINTTIEDLCTLNDMYKGTSNGGVDRN